MKKLNIIISILCFTWLIPTANLKAQNYATLNYWGKNIPLDRDFFYILNNNRIGFNEKTKTWRYYDFQDYNQLYSDLVDNLKSPSFTIIVTEANGISHQNELSNLPNSNETNKNKKNRARAGWQYYNLLLPSLQEFARGRM